jgi:hypothetical protein
MEALVVFGDRMKPTVMRVAGDAVSIPMRIKTMGSVENTIAGMG